LFIAIGLANKLAAPIWGQMKSDINSAFSKDVGAGDTAAREQFTFRDLLRHPMRFSSRNRRMKSSW
jgi:hypothetical protein